MAAPLSDDPEENKMPLIEHLLELRRRLMWAALTFVVAFFACFYVAQPIFGILVEPLAVIMKEVGGSTERMIFTALTEPFFTYIKVAAFGAGVITFPVFASQLWMFIAPGLYRHEKKAFLPFLFASPVLFAAGAALVYFFVIPMAWRFLLGYQSSGEETVLPIQLEARVGEYLDLIMKLVFAFGLSFQMPIALVLLARTGMVSAAGLAAKRRYAIVGVFVLAAILTPPDVISQIGLAVPLIFLYELSIIGARLVEKKRDADLVDDDLDDDLEDGESEDAPVEKPTATAATTSTAPAAPGRDQRALGVEETDFNA